MNINCKLNNKYKHFFLYAIIRAEKKIDIHEIISINFLSLFLQILFIFDIDIFIEDPKTFIPTVHFNIFLYMTKWLLSKYIYIVNGGKKFTIRFLFCLIICVEIFSKIYKMFMYYICSIKFEMCSVL